MIGPWGTRVPFGRSAAAENVNLVFEFGTQQELQLLALLVCGGGAADPRRAAADPVPDPARASAGCCSGSRRACPTVTMPPEVVLIGILPPLLYIAAYFTGLRELRQNLRPISLLAVGLVR